MKVVFLDFDGVLNTGFGPGHPILVGRLNRITRQTGAVIVVHSSWRTTRSVDQLRTILASWGVRGPVVDKCPSPLNYQQTPTDIWVGEESWADFKRGILSDHERCIAIQRWLNDHPEVERYVILDDCPDLGHFVGKPEFIRTDMRTGLTEAQTERAITDLGGG